jgi:tRNA1(Val) A37 N6-methylase TrmN6
MSGVKEHELLHPAAPAEPDELGELTDDAIAGPYRVLQRKKGHRYSLDDVITAWQGARAMPAARRCLELGSGIGSVLLMLAYKLPDAKFVAIEAQRNSFQLLGENVKRNALDGRVRRIHGDLRVQTTREALGLFDLVTGTPPYVAPEMATPSPDAQRAYARQEFRGGVEGYVQAASKVLALHGRAVVCADARFPERVEDSARDAGLRVIQRRDVVPRAGASPLFSVFTLASRHAALVPYVHEVWEARDARGARTEAYHRVRAFFGMAVPTHEEASP